MSQDGSGTTTAPRPSSGGEGRGNPVARLARFFREVVAELRKVIWPTRKELITYTSVVLVFVAFMIALVFAFDTVFARVVLEVFG